MPTLQEIKSRTVIWVYKIEKGETKFFVQSRRYMDEIMTLFGTDLIQIVDGYSVKKIYKGEW